MDGFNVQILSWVSTLPQANFQRKPWTFEGTIGFQTEGWEGRMEARDPRKTRKQRKNPKTIRPLS